MNKITNHPSSSYLIDKDDLNFGQVQGITVVSKGFVTVPSIVVCAVNCQHSGAVIRLPTPTDANQQTISRPPSDFHKPRKPTDYVQLYIISTHETLLFG